MVDEHTPEQPPAEGTTEPEPVQEQASEPEPATEPVPVPEPGAVPVTDDEVTDPEPEAATGEPEPTPEVEPEPLAVPEPGAVPASEAEVADDAAAPAEGADEPEAEAVAAPGQPEPVASPATTAPRPQPTPPRPTTSLTRELILPAVRLDVPDRPSADQVAALATRGPDDWTTSARDRVTQQVVRLAVAQVLTARVTRPGPGAVQGGAEGAPGRAPLSTDPAEVTLRQAAGLFRPHVDLAAQAFRLAVVEAVNAGVPAATDPVREGLRRLGVTGREPVRMVALGLDRVPSRGRQAFWAGLADSGTVSAFVADLAAATGGKGRTPDVSGLDRSLLARADALVLAGGRTTPVVLGGRPVEAGGWLQVPFAVGRRRTGAQQNQGQAGGRPSVEVGLRGAGWVEVVDATLQAVSAAMTEIDLGSRPKALRLQGLPEAVAGRLVAAADRTVAEVCASLRDVDPDVLELFDARVTTAAVPAVVPVPEEEQLAQLWLPGSALAAPLFTAAVDLYLGEGSEVRASGGRPDGGRSDRGRPEGSRSGGRPGGGRGSDGPRRPRPADAQGAEADQTQQPGQPGQAGQPGQPGEPGSRGGRPRRGGRGRRRTEGGQPDTGGGTTPPAGEAAPTPPGAPSSTPPSTPSEPSSAPQPGGESGS